MKKLIACITTFLIITIASTSLFLLQRKASINAQYLSFDEMQELEEVKVNDDTAPVVSQATTQSRRIIYIPKKPTITNASVTLPLVQEDYYYGKHFNATVAASELNSLKNLKAGDRISIVKHGYLTMEDSKGYIDPPGDKYPFASGVCWTVSTLGYLMDEANVKFKAKYGIPLFVFEKGDRIPHKHSYTTYAPSNNGYGYTVTINDGWIFDYKFTINPNLADHPKLQHIRLKIVMYGTTDHPSGYNGESIGAELKTNVKW